MAYRSQSSQTLYATVGRGFKAGGFNPASPPGSESYGEEHTWNVEGGVKTAWAGGRVTANASAFLIDWDDLQLNLPNLVGARTVLHRQRRQRASSAGVELEVNARAHARLDVFGTLGYTHARFGDGAISSGVDVSDNDIPNTPEYTASLGAQFNHAVDRRRLALRARRDRVLRRLPLRRPQSRGSGGVLAGQLPGRRPRPVRLRRSLGPQRVRHPTTSRSRSPTAQLAPSGFVGEMGAPRTFGVSGGVTF